MKKKMSKKEAKSPAPCWQGERVANYEYNQRIHVMGKAGMLRAAVEALPFARSWRGRVLEIGAGQGALSQVLLRRYPKCSLTLLDGSPEMLERARQKLTAFAGRAQVVQADFNTSGWHKNLAPPYDAIITSLALHYLKPAKRKAFFRSCHRLLSAAGWFVDADLFDGECEMLTARAEEMHARYAQRQIRRLTGERIPLDELIARRSDGNRRFVHYRSTLPAETAQLLDAGFSAAGCVWRLWCIAVVVACKAGAEKKLSAE
jgi:SAM-dependent methyltransferase